MNKELLPQQGHQIGERPVEFGLQLQEAQQEHGNQSGPDLSLDSIGAGAHKSLDLAELFERLEEQFHLPAVLVDGGNGRGCKFKVVSQEDQLLLVLLIPDHDAAEEQVFSVSGMLEE